MSHYDVLGVERTADRATLREAYLRLARAHHPDRAGGDPARMQAINAAWAVLGDPERRAVYDLSLSGGGRSAAPTAPPASRPRHKPGYEPDPRYDPTDDIPEHIRAHLWEDPDLLFELRDDRPLGADIVLPRWTRMIPAGTFAASIAVFIFSVVLASEPGIAFAFMLLLLSVVFFLAAPFIALLAAHRGDNGRQRGT